MMVSAVLEHITVPHVQLSSQTSLADTVRAMNAEGVPVALLVDKDGWRGVVTSFDLLRALELAPTIEQGWGSEVAQALARKCKSVAVAPGDRIATVIDRMAATGCDHLVLSADHGPVVLSFSKLLLCENTLLRREVEHLQTYIDALHDAPND